MMALSPRDANTSLFLSNNSASTADNLGMCSAADWDALTGITCFLSKQR